MRVYQSRQIVDIWGPHNILRVSSVRTDKQEGSAARPLYLIASVTSGDGTTNLAASRVRVLSAG